MTNKEPRRSLRHTPIDEIISSEPPKSRQSVADNTRLGTPCGRPNNTEFFVNRTRPQTTPKQRQEEMLLIEEFLKTKKVKNLPYVYGLHTQAFIENEDDTKAREREMLDARLSLNAKRTIKGKTFIPGTHVKFHHTVAGVKFQLGGVVSADYSGDDLRICVNVTQDDGSIRVYKPFKSFCSINRPKRRPKHEAT